MTEGMENPADINGGEAQNRLNNAVAVMVAIVAAFMAVTKVKDDNIVQAMLQAKSDAVDTWSEYQSKRIKQHLEELGRDQSQMLRASVPAESAARLDEQTKARGLEAQYDALNYRDDQFDLSDAALSVALAMLAVTALTGKRWLLWASLLFAGFGVLMGLAGLFGLHLHPDWLTKLLS